VKILIADDSRVMRKIVVRTLRQAGYTGHQILEAGSGDEALDLARRESPDLILSDWNMPGLNGIDMLGKLRAAGSTVPFGFVTSEGSPEMRQRAESAGALFLIAKPFTPESFHEALDPVLAS
jgi:two-component system chemotaxis response regulator CheY